VQFGIPRPRDPKALAEPLKPNPLTQQCGKGFSTGLPTDLEPNSAAQTALLSLLTRTDRAPTRTLATCSHRPAPPLLTITSTTSSESI